MLNQFLEILTIVLPVFLVVGLGYMVKRSSMVDANFLFQLNRLIYYIALPSLLFYKIATAEFTASFNGTLVVALLLTVIVGSFLFYGFGVFRNYPDSVADKILQSKSALEGERKQVTVMFADVKGSMELAEQLDPEEWHRILEQFFAILTEGVHRFEGTVNQYTGDGVMALFGAPVVREDHVHRACYAALHLRDAVLCSLIRRRARARHRARDARALTSAARQSAISISTTRSRARRTSAWIGRFAASSPTS